MTDFTSSIKSRVSALAENARDLTLEFEAASGSRFFDNDDQTMKEVQSLLNSRLDREKLEALRRLVALMSRGTDVSSYFASVIQLIASPNLEIKKLVYIYLLRYAESNPDLALMSINTIQKSLSDKNQIVRGMALRVMSGIKVPLISGIVILGIRRCLTDLSFFVRNVAAVAIINLDPGLKQDLIPLLSALLMDKIPSVLACALSAWEHVCPERTDLLHRPYRQICRLLIEMDEWGQLVAMRVLTIYVRRCFYKPDKAPPAENNHITEFYEDNSNRSSSSDPDLELLYKCALQLVHSRSNAVIIALTRLFQSIAPPSYIHRLVPSLIRLLRSRSSSVLYPSLSSLAVIASQNPTLFTPYLRCFYATPTDPTHIALLKLDILITCSTEATLLPILRELNHYSKSGDPEIVKEAIRGVARCAMKCSSDKAIDKCAAILGKGVRSRNDALSTPATSALRTLIQLNPEAYAKYIHLLAQSLGEIHSSPAKAEIIWLVGEYASQLAARAADILRISLQDFADQDEDVKYQVITLAAKVYVLYFPQPPTDVDSLDSHLKQVHLLYTYAMSLSRYDLSYDLRDRARLLKSVHLSPFREAALHTPKPVPRMESLGEHRAEWMLGSMAQIIARNTPGEMILPEWGSEIPDKGVRDSPEQSVQSTNVASTVPVASVVPKREEKKMEKKIWKDLDKFYASESEEEEDEESEAEEEGSTEEESDEETGDDSGMK